MEEDARRLATTCDEAFDLYPHDCSHAVWHVIKSYNAKQPYMQANALVSHMARSPEWKEVSLNDLSGGEKQYSQPSGMYARAMSTSLSRHPFPGAISRGDKTVRDPWPARQFQQVKFWKYVGTTVSVPGTQKENAKRFRNSSEEIWI